MNRAIALLRTCIAASLLAVPALADGPRLTVELDRPGVPINRGMWGIFFEDINFGADGGLYAELVKNRGFEFPEPLMGWFKLSPKGAPGTLAVRDEQPFHVRNPHYLRIESPGGNSPFGIANEGFRGMGVKPGFVRFPGGCIVEGITLANRYQWKKQRELAAAVPRTLCAVPCGPEEKASCDQARIQCRPRPE